MPGPFSYELVHGEKLISWPRSEGSWEEGAESGRRGAGRRMKRSKESHELPQGLTLRPYQPGSSTVLFIALNRAPTIWGRAIVPARTPLSPYLSLTPRLSIAMPCRYRAVIYGDIKSGPNYCRVIAQFGADAASIRRRHLRGEIRRIVKGERRQLTPHGVSLAGVVGRKIQLSVRRSFSNANGESKVLGRTWARFNFASCNN